MTEPTAISSKQTPEQAARAALAQAEYDKRIARAQDEGAEKALTMIRGVTNAAVDKMALRLADVHAQQLQQTAAFHVERLNAYAEGEKDRLRVAAQSSFIQCALWLGLPGIVLSAALASLATLYAVERVQSSSFTAASEFGASQATVGAMIGERRGPEPCTYPNGLNEPGVTPTNQPCSYEQNPFTQRRIAAPASAP